MSKTPVFVRAACSLQMVADVREFPARDEAGLYKYNKINVKHLTPLKLLK